MHKDTSLDDLNALPADAPWLKLCVIALDNFLRAVAPASFGLWALVLAQISLARSINGSVLRYIRIPRWLLIYAALECAFFAFYLQRKRRILKDEHPLIAPTDTERERLFARVLESFETAEETKSFIRGWFHTREAGRWTGAARHVEIGELRHDNVNELLANAFFNQTLQDVRAHPQHSAVLERFLQTVEEKIQHVFPAGYNEEIDCIRQMLEDVPVEHRPFIFYAATFAASTLVSTALKLAGFRKEVLIAPLVDPSRAGRRRREAQAFEYFVHSGPDPSTGKTADAKLPIVICAGLAGIVGIFHVACYLMWKTRRPIFVVGLPAVSLRLQEVGTRPRSASDVWYDNDGFGNETLWEPVGDRHKQVRATIPSLDLQARGLRLMIDRYGYTGAVFVSHSLGTSLMSFAARQDPPMVKFSILIDPITFMIWHSRLVKIFLYKKPDAVGEHFIRLFSREAGIVSVVSRAFFWHQVASFIKPTDSTLPYRGDTVEPRKTFVILSSEDALIPARQIAERLQKGGIPFWMLEGEHHASWLLSRATFLKVMRLIIEEADKADIRTSPIMISRPSFLRADSSATGSLAKRRSSSFFGGPQYEPPGMCVSPYAQFACSERHSRQDEAAVLTRARDAHSDDSRNEAKGEQCARERTADDEPYSRKGRMTFDLFRERPLSLHEMRLFEGSAAFALLLGVRGYFKGSLNASGSICAVVLGYLALANELRVFGSCMIALYLCGSRATKANAEIKARLEDGHDTQGGAEGNRNAAQVACNAHLGVLCSVLFRALYGSAPSGACSLDATMLNTQPISSPALIMTGVAFFAACLGDTLASELGILAKSRPVLITTWRYVPPGTNGGVTSWGTVCSFGGGLIIGMVAQITMHINEHACGFRPKLIAVATVAGGLGSLIDSLLGATLQETRFSVRRKRILVGPHVAMNIKDPHVHISGRPILSNNQVNLISSTVTALFLGYLGSSSAFDVYTSA